MRYKVPDAGDLSPIRQIRRTHLLKATALEFIIPHSPSKSTPTTVNFPIAPPLLPPPPEDPLPLRPLSSKTLPYPIRATHSHLPTTPSSPFLLPLFKIDMRPIPATNRFKLKKGAISRKIRNIAPFRLPPRRKRNVSPIFKSPQNTDSASSRS